jgi:hypothetical protein
MSSDLTRPSGGSVTRRYGPIRRLGSGIGLATIGILDLLALEDITTAGAWMPEIGFLIASVPALIVLVYFLLARSTGEEESR